MVHLEVGAVGRVGRVSGWWVQCMGVRGGGYSILREGDPATLLECSMPAHGLRIPLDRVFSLCLRFVSALSPKIWGAMLQLAQ
jgi:hypothetical protein